MSRFMICRKCECRTRYWPNQLCEDCDTRRQPPEAVVAVVGSQSRIDHYRRRVSRGHRLFAKNDSNLIEINLE